MAGRCLCPHHAHQAPRDFPSRFTKALFDPIQQKDLAYAVHHVALWQDLYDICVSWQQIPVRRRLYDLRSRWPLLTPKDFDAFFLLYPCFLDHVTDWIPHGGALILAVEKLRGAIEPNTVEDAQHWCMSYANQATRTAYHAQFLEYLSQARCLDDASLTELADHMVQDIPDRVKSINQKRTSIAGSVHQLLCQRLLESLHWHIGTEFKNLNSSTRGDIQVFNSDRSQSVITEVKSLNARERLRGSLNRATAAHHDVVGFGFFHNPMEFGLQATIELIQTNAQAIYLPSETLAQLTSAVRQAVNASQQPFYRPITQYAADMLAFHHTGHFV